MRVIDPAELANDQERYQRETVVTAEGLTIFQLRQYWERVACRGAIDKTFKQVSAEERLHISKAIKFFSGSNAKWERVGESGWRVRAAGIDF